jgi:hypothetical protein
LASLLSTVVVWIVAAIFVLGGLAIYLRQIHAIRREGGKVEVACFDLPELFVSFVFAGLFAMLTISAVMRHGGKEPEINVDSVLPNSILFIFFTVGVAALLSIRKLRLREAFGIRRIPLLAVLGWAAGLLVTALPLASAANALTALLFHGAAEPQPLVELFNKAAQTRQYNGMIQIVISAVLIQPACEEFLFRGFFYGVWKRYLGPVRSGLFASLLFAAFHTNLAAFAGLFVLAVCLNIAYERTGSLLVPVLMHALFNLSSLVFIYAQARFGASN